MAEADSDTPIMLLKLDKKLAKYYNVIKIKIFFEEI